MPAHEMWWFRLLAVCRVSTFNHEVRTEHRFAMDSAVLPTSPISVRFCSLWWSSSPAVNNSQIAPVGCGRRFDYIVLCFAGTLFALRPSHDVQEVRFMHELACGSSAVARSINPTPLFGVLKNINKVHRLGLLRHRHSCAPGTTLDWATVRLECNSSGVSLSTCRSRTRYQLLYVYRRGARPK